MRKVIHLAVLACKQVTRHRVRSLLTVAGVAAGMFLFTAVVFCPPLPTWNAVFNFTSNDFNATTDYWCRTGDAFTDSGGDETIRKWTTCTSDKTWQDPIVECVGELITS